MGRPITDLYLPRGYRPRYLTMNELLQQVGRVEGERTPVIDISALSLRPSFRTTSISSEEGISACNPAAALRSPTSSPSMGL